MHIPNSGFISNNPHKLRLRNFRVLKCFQRYVIDRGPLAANENKGRMKPDGSIARSNGYSSLTRSNTHMWQYHSLHLCEKVPNVEERYD